MSGDSKEGYATGGGEGASSGSSSGASSPPRAGPAGAKQRDKARVSRTSLILWHTHQNDVAAVRKLLEEDRGLVNARDYDYRTPLHVAALHGWIDVAKCLLDHGADVNAQDRWKNTVSYIYTGCPLADAAGAKKPSMIELLKSYGGSSYVNRGMAYLHNEPNVIIHRDLKPRLVHLAIDKEITSFLVAEFCSLTDECWAADLNRRPSFLVILKRLEKIKENVSPEHHWSIFNQ
ncbi:hypothetical protein BHM03_00003735 [Ensete ventricosum]|nr:hypothetical protein BHM03_00003735 [Ensete ventricosum]